MKHLLSLLGHLAFSLLLEHSNTRVTDVFTLLRQRCLEVLIHLFVSLASGLLLHSHLTYLWLRVFKKFSKGWKEGINQWLDGSLLVVRLGLGRDVLKWGSVSELDYTNNLPGSEEWAQVLMTLVDFSLLVHEAISTSRTLTRTTKTRLVHSGTHFVLNDLLI